jgi:hypothetical protein
MPFLLHALSQGWFYGTVNAKYLWKGVKYEVLFDDGDKRRGMDRLVSTHVGLSRDE